MGFMKGLIVGAIVPSIIAYKAYARLWDLTGHCTRQVTVAADITDSLRGMDKNIEAFVRGINVVQMGCEYRNGEGPLEALKDALRRNVEQYETARDNIYTDLEQYTKGVEESTGTHSSTLYKLSEARAKTKEYADKIF